MGRPTRSAIALGYPVPAPKLLIAAALLAAAAADDVALDVTITVIESPADLPSTVTSKIELPRSAANAARTHSPRGTDPAGEARAHGRETDQSVAEEAKDNGHGRGRGRGNGKP